MFSKHSILVATLALCVSGIIGIVTLNTRQDVGGVILWIWIIAPILGIAAGSAWWRGHRWLPFVGLAVAAVALALTLWGNGTDYLNYHRHPPRPGQIHFTPGRFFAWLLSGFLCVGFWVSGAVAWAFKRAPEVTRPNGGGVQGTTRERPRLDRIVLWLACGLYLTACALPATERWGSVDHLGSSMVQRGGQPYTTEPGWYCLLMGWTRVPYILEFGRLNQLGLLAWLANPLALAGALLLVRRTTGAVAFSAASFVVGVLYVIDPPAQNGHPELPRIGAWLWLGSFLALTVAALIRRGGRQTHEPDEPGAGHDGGA